MSVDVPRALPRLPNELTDIIWRYMLEVVIESTTPVTWNLHGDVGYVSAVGLRYTEPRQRQLQQSMLKTRLDLVIKMLLINRSTRNLVEQGFDMIPRTQGFDRVPRTQLPRVFVPVHKGCDVFMPGTHHLDPGFSSIGLAFSFHMPSVQPLCKIKYIQCERYTFFGNWWQALRRAQPYLQCLRGIILSDHLVHLALEYNIIPRDGTRVPLPTSFQITASPIIHDGQSVRPLMGLGLIANGIDPRSSHLWAPFEAKGVRLFVREKNALRPRVEIIVTRQQGLFLQRIPPFNFANGMY